MTRLNPVARRPPHSTTQLVAKRRPTQLRREATVTIFFRSSLNFSRLQLQCRQSGEL